MCPSIFQFLASSAGTLPSSNTWIRFNMLPNSFVYTCSGLQQSINFNPILCHASTKHFLHQTRDFSLSVHSNQIMPSKVTLSPFSKISSPKKWSCAFHWHLQIFAAFFPHLMHRYLLASADHSVPCFVSSFWSTKIRFSCGFGLSSLQTLHSSTKQ